MKGVKVAFDLRIDGLTSSTYGLISYNALFFSPPPTSFSSQALVIQQIPGSASFAFEEDNGFPAAVNQPLGLKYGQWQRIEMDLIVSTSPNKGVIRLDGVPISSLDVGVTVVTAIELRLGPWFAREATATATVHYDNVTIDEL